MARFRYKHIQSTVKDKIPSDLLDGELAVNRFKGEEKIFLKNANNEIISFSSDSLINKELENKADVSDFSAHTANTEIHVTAADKTAWDAKVDASAIANFFDDAKYEDSGTTKVINFYHGNTIKATIDASDFIVDGMVEDVRIENGYLVIDFNTASGKQDISIPLTNIFDPSNYYTKSETSGKTEIQTALSNKADTATTYTKGETSGATELATAFNAKLDATAYTPTDLSNYYTKSETSGATEISNALGGKVNSATFTAHTASTVHMNDTEKTNLDSLATNIAAISGITSTKVGNWDTAASNSHSHGNKAALDGITGAVGTMAYQNTSSYSSATQVNTALSNKADVSETVTSTTSADYVKMVTTGGNEVKITKASFVEAMADILNNSDKGANVNKVTVTGTDGKFGSVNLTNLASVLGVVSATDITYDTANKKITKTVNGVTSDVVTAAKIVEDGVGTLYDAEIEYLESTGTQYIDTSIGITSSSKIELSVIGTNNSDTMVFGASNGFAYDEGAVELGWQNTNMSITYPTSDSASSLLLKSYTVGTKYDIGYTFSSCTINGNTSTFSAYQSYVARRSLYIYATNRGSAVGMCSAKLYSFKVYDGTILVFDAIPVRVGNVGYLYDKVSGHLFGNAGTGDFVLGQDTSGSGGSRIDTLTRHTRLIDFDLNVLKQAVAAQNLEKYGLKVGDQKTINGHTYVIAELNPVKGLAGTRVRTNHVGLIVIPHTTQKWNASNNTSIGANGRGAGYMNSDLHYYLKNTLFPLVEEDLGATNLIRCHKQLSNAVTDGKSSGWAWENYCEISALSEIQVYGSIVWSSSGFDTGEACRQLDVFRNYNYTEIFGEETIWLRGVVSASEATEASNLGRAGRGNACNTNYVAALILFN